MQGATRDFRDSRAFRGTGTFRAFRGTKKGAFRALSYNIENELSQESIYFYLKNIIIPCLKKIANVSKKNLTGKNRTGSRKSKTFLKRKKI